MSNRNRTCPRVSHLNTVDVGDPRVSLESSKSDNEVVLLSGRSGRLRWTPTKRSPCTKIAIIFTSRDVRWTCVDGGAYERSPVSRVAELSPIYHRGLSSSLQAHALVVTVIIISLCVCTTSTTDAKDGQCVGETIRRDKEPPMFTYNRRTSEDRQSRPLEVMSNESRALRCPDTICFLKKKCIK